ncbi:MAG: hypothetical protein SPL43_05500 [Prevotella sp.]|nr:hypothetical protein [Prevotella sp.]
MKRKFRIAHAPCGWVCLLLILLGCLQAQAQDTKVNPVNPVCKFTPSSLEVTVGQLNVTKPTLSVTDKSGKSIRGRFVESWSIQEASTEITEDNRVKYVDKATGSKVSRLYGLESIGDTAGTFTVVDVLTPQDRYAKYYNSVTATYTVTVKSPTVTAEYYNGSTLLNAGSALQIYKYGGDKYTSIPVPTAKFYYKLDNSTYDVTSYYDYTYDVTDGFSKDYNNNITASKVGDGTLTITATPKEKYQAMLGDKAITTTVKLESAEHTGKIKTYISFAKHELDTYKFRNNQDKDRINTPDVIVKDEYGNDITSLVNTSNVDWKNTAQNVFKNFSQDPHDAINETNVWYGTLKSDNTNTVNVGTMHDNSKKLYGSIQFGRPDDYIITVNVNLSNTDLYEKPVADPNFTALTVNGQFYNANGDAPYSKENTYTVASNQLLLRVHKRVPTIKLTPDPSTIELAEGYTMTAFNRFNIIGEIKDPYTSDPTETKSFDNNDFHYRFFLPDNMVYGSDAAKKEPKNVTLEVKTNATSTEFSEWVPAYHNGVIETNADGTTKMELMHGTYYDSWKGYGNENFSMVFHLPEGEESAENVPIIYSIVPWNPIVMDVGISGYYNFKIVKKEPTHFVIDPQKQVTGTGGTVPCPSIAIHDQFEADITDLFNVSRAKADNNDSYTLNANGSVTSGTAGSYNVNVNGTLKDATSATSNGRFFENPTQDSYTAVFKQTSSGVGAYEIIYDDKEFSDDAATKAKSKMGKLHFITKGDFYPGTISYGEVPGINITFGSAGDVNNPWSIQTGDEGPTANRDNDNDKDENGKNSMEYIEGDAVTIDDNTHLPTAGCFLKIYAITNGWLTIDSKFLSHKDEEGKTPEHYILVNASTMEMQQSKTFTEDSYGEYTFPKALLAGNTYYLYTNDGQMILHGLNYTPAFIDPVTDKKPWTTPGAIDDEPVTVSSAFVNGYTGILPTLTMHRPNENVSWHCLDVSASSTSTSVNDIKEYTNNDAKHVYVGQTDGIIYPKALTSEAPLNNSSREKTDAYSRVKIFGRVLGKKVSTDQQVRKEPAYWLFIGDMPTYIVQAGETHDQEDRVSTTNIPTRIWMKFGGWQWAPESEYPYYKNNVSEKGWLADGWKTAKMDSVGRNNQTIDGFHFTTWGEQNPSDEAVKGWDKGKRNTFNLPVRGTYLKFEPEESGQLLVYLCQNGMTDISKNDDAKRLEKNGPWLRRRAVYIVDETGKPVAIDDMGGWHVGNDWNQYVNAGQTNADRYPGYHNLCLNYYCDGMTRCAWDYATGKELKISTANPADPSANKNDKKYSWFRAYDRDNDGKLSTTEQKNLDADIKKIHDWWTATSYSYDKTVDGKRLTSSLNHAKLDGPLEVLQLSDSSYVLPTKGYVRYTFHVLAGKTYYVFATGSKLGFCGFGFLPAGYRANSSKWTNAGTPNEYGEFSDNVYANLPKVTDDIYKPGKTGNTRLMGGVATLDVTKKATDDGSYDKFAKGGYAIDGDNTTANGTTTKRDFVNVTLKRTFRNKRWHGICLPFSLSETQMHKVFGDDAVVITFDSIMATGEQERAIHFTQHSNQLMEAGRPYFIRPSWSDKGDGAEVSDLTFSHVTFENKDAMSLVCYNEGVRKVHEDFKNGAAAEDKDIFTYKITGVYDKTLIPWYSYFMRNNANADENKLYRIVPQSGSDDKGAYLPGMNVYLYPYSADVSGSELVTTTDGDNHAKMASFWITGAEVAGGSTTSIDQLVDEINTEATSFVSGVYDLQGHCVRTTNNLKGLQPGIYIMGGKKYVIK